MQHQWPSPIVVFGLVTLVVASGTALADDKRLIFIGVHGSEGIPPNAIAAIEDVVRAELPQAAKVRGFTLAPLEQASGVALEASTCERAPCRRDIARKLAASHVLAARIEALRPTTPETAKEKRPSMSAEPGRIVLVKPGDLKKDKAIDITIPRPETLVHGPAGSTDRTIGRGYRVTLWLEDAKSSDVVDAVRLEGEVPFLVGQSRIATDKLLEAASPRDVVARERLKKTAQSYEKAGRVRDAVRSYRRAVSTAPFHPDAALLMLEIVRVYDRAGALDDANATITEWVDGYGPRSAWGRAGIGGDDVQSKLASEATTLLFDRATHAHHAAQALVVVDDVAALEVVPPDVAETQAKKASLIDTSLLSYRLFVESYPDHEDAPRAALYFAEALFDAGRYEEAADAFAQAAAVTHPGQKDAARGAVYALEREIEKAGADGRIEPFNPDKALRVPPKEMNVPLLFRRYIEAIDRAVVVDPTNEFTPTFALRAAQAYAAYGQRAAAKERLSAIVANWPRSKAAPRAKELLSTL
jgi:hypothetical protein